MNQQPEITQLVDHLFRHEAGKLIAVMTRIFGVENIALAEDVVHDSFIEAMINWLYMGVPENPPGWLFRVARNKALNHLNKEKKNVYFSTDVIPLFCSVQVDGRTCTGAFFFRGRNPGRPVKNDVHLLPPFHSFRFAGCIGA